MKRMLTDDSGQAEKYDNGTHEHDADVSAAYIENRITQGFVTPAYQEPENSKVIINRIIEKGGTPQFDPGGMMIILQIRKSRESITQIKNNKC